MKLTVEIASVPDRDHLVAEIWLEDEMIAEATQDDAGVFILELYPNPNGGSWKVGLENLVQTLDIAKKIVLLNRAH